VTVVMKNTGTTTWTIGETYHLRSQNPEKNFTWGVDRADLATADAIAPGQSKTFTWSVTAPGTAGTYNFQWQMRRSSTDQWFGDLTPNVAVVVSTTPPPPPPPPTPGGTNLAEFVSQSVPTSMTAGTDVQVTVTLRNAGTTTWTNAGGYRLSSRGARDNTVWGLNRVYLAPGDAIAPGQTHTFTFDVTAPAAAGSYPMSWSMVQEGVDWFNAVTPVVDVTVTAVGAPPPAVSAVKPGGNKNGNHTINDKCSGAASGLPAPWSLIGVAALALLARRRSSR
jgi:hypothetical protein